MLRLVIEGPNFETVKRERIGSRALIEENGKILLSLLGERNQYLTPGGGIEKGESVKDAVIRECQEEAGVLVDSDGAFLVIDEYYGSKHWQNYYSRASIIEKVPTKYDEKEKILDLQAVWVDENKLEEIFSIKMTWRDEEGESEEKIFAIKNSHFRELCAYRISKGLDLPKIPKYLSDSIKSVSLTIL